MYCRGAYEFEVDRNNLHSELIAQLAKFNFIWGSLETALDLISPPAAPKYKGKINAACYYLQQNFAPSSPIEFYDEFLHKLKKLIQNIPYYSGLLAEFSLKPHRSHYGIGLYVVYRIRNRFAHGALALPLPSDGPERDLDKLLI